MDYFGTCARNSLFSSQPLNKNVLSRLPRFHRPKSTFRRATVGSTLVALLCASVVSRAANTTSTTLSVASGGIDATSVAVGATITLTATVVSNGAAVHPGTVRFCDLTASETCSEVSMLGTAQLTSDGTARLGLRLGVGTHSLEAVFVGTNGYSESQSEAHGLTVTGLYPSATSFSAAAGSSAGSYDMTATVFGLGPASAAFPTGTISFQNASQANKLLASVSLATGSTTRVFDVANVWSGTTQLLTTNTAEGDFNRDGKPDLAVSNSTDSTVAVFLGNGDGTFATPVSYALGNDPTFVAVGDVNNDGKLDLVVTNNSDNTVSVLLGNGDGTFQKQQTFTTDKQPVAVSLGDLNGDGNLDLVLGVQVGALSVMLGNGDGTFQAFHSYQITDVLSNPVSPSGVIAGDFNGDGKLDVAASTEGGYSGTNNVAVMLGNGDGTLQAPSYYSSMDAPSNSIGMGDFNGDGKVDLAITNISGCCESSVSVMLGNGDGTFQQQVFYDLPGGIGLQSIQVADFDGDGNQDLSVATINEETATLSNQVAILFGKGDGTFNAPQFFDLATQPYSEANSVAAGDLNGDGHPDIVAVQTFYGATQDSVVSLLSSGVSASATATGVTISGTGAQIIQASYDGDGVYSPSVSTGTSLSPIGPAPLTWSAPAPVVYGTALGAAQLNATSTAEGTFAYSPAAGTVLPVGTNTLSVTFTPADTTQYTTATSSVQLMVTPAPLTVSANNAARVFGAANPEFTGTIAGAVKGDSFTETFSTTATTSSIVGTYPITPAVSGPALANYTVSLVNGALTISQAGTSTKFALSNDNLTLTGTVSSLTSGTPTGSVNFLSGETPIGNAPLVNGSATLTVSSVLAGNSTISAQYSGDANFTQSASPGVAVIGFAAASGSLTVAQTGTVSDVLTITPVDGLVATLQASCSGLPMNASCSFQPSSVALSGTGGVATLSVTIQTGNSTTATLQPAVPGGSGSYLLMAIALWLPGWLTGALGYRIRKKRGRTGDLLMWICLLGGLAAVSSCGGGSTGGSSSGTPAGSSTVQVTLNGGGNLTQSVNLNLTVQ